jgi:hypothetical protein
LPGVQPLVHELMRPYLQSDAYQITMIYPNGRDPARLYQRGRRSCWKGAPKRLMSDETQEPTRDGDGDPDTVTANAHHRTVLQKGRRIRRKAKTPPKFRIEAIQAPGISQEESDRRWQRILELLIESYEKRRKAET